MNTVRLVFPLTIPGQSAVYGLVYRSIIYMCVMYLVPLLTLLIRVILLIRAVNDMKKKVNLSALPFKAFCNIS